MKRRTRIDSGAGEGQFELDLAPMLALMVTLIPIMLLSTAFVKVTVIETALPQAVQQAIEEDRKKKDREVEVHLVLNENKSFHLSVTEAGRTKMNVKASSLGDKWNIDRLHKELVRVKQKYPRTFRLSLRPSEKISYDEIVKVIDAARSTNKDDPKLFLIDKKTNKSVESKSMFPDILFSNVLEG